MTAIELNNEETTHVIKKMVHDLRSPLAHLEMINRLSRKPWEKKELGLIQMRETMSKCNGHFTISYEPDTGTKIILSFKLEI